MSRDERREQKVAHVLVRTWCACLMVTSVLVALLAGLFRPGPPSGMLHVALYFTVTLGFTFLAADLRWGARHHWGEMVSMFLPLILWLTLFVLFGQRKGIANFVVEYCLIAPLTVGTVVAMPWLRARAHWTDRWLLLPLVTGIVLSASVSLLVPPLPD